MKKLGAWMVFTAILCCFVIITKLIMFSWVLGLFCIMVILFVFGSFLMEHDDDNGRQSH